MAHYIDRTLEQVETCVFDRLGYVPFLSTISGAFRAMLGTAEIVSAIGLAIFFQYQTAATYAVHGTANLMRATAEIIPFINLITMTYDGCLDNQNKPARMSYLPPAIDLGPPPQYAPEDAPVAPPAYDLEPPPYAAVDAPAPPPPYDIGKPEASAPPYVFAGASAPGLDYVEGGTNN